MFVHFPIGCENRDRGTWPSLHSTKCSEPIQSGHVWQVEIEQHYAGSQLHRRVKPIGASLSGPDLISMPTQMRSNSFVCSQIIIHDQDGLPRRVGAGLWEQLDQRRPDSTAYPIEWRWHDNAEGILRIAV